MDTSTFSLIVAIVASVAGAVWVLRSKLTDIEMALHMHIVSTSAELKTLSAKIIRLEERRPGTKK